MKKFSVIIPVYNPKKSFYDGLVSVYNSRNSCGFTGNAEIIIADDFSGRTDYLKEIISFSDKIIKNNKRRGAGFTRNKGAAAAAGKYLVFLDSDCFVEKDFFEKLDNLTEKHKIICGHIIKPYSDNFVSNLQFYESYLRRPKEDGYLDVCQSYCFIISKQIFSATGGFPEGYITASTEDIDFCVKLSRKNHKPFYSTEIKVIHDYNSSLKKYLIRQFVFARDSLISFFKNPEIINFKTHQGKKLYIEIVVYFLTLILILPIKNIFFAWLFIPVIFNLTLFSKLMVKEYLKLFFTLHLRNLIIIISLMYSLFFCVPSTLMKKFKKGQKV